MVKSKNVDAYKGVDVKDKLMIVSGSGLPDGVTRSDLRGKPGVDWADPPTYAQSRGAKGIIIMPGFQNLAFWDRIRRNATERGQIAVEKFQNENTEPQVPTIIASLGMLNTLFRGESQSASGLFNHSVAGAPGAAFDLTASKKASFTVSGQAAETVNTQNVVAVLEGSDPVLKNEYVALGAHYDHVGIGAPVAGDAIYNGADDDGSGTTALLAIADALAHSSPRPKRSVLFVWHCGEEKGLWGSRYFTQNPTVPLERVVAQLNIDMIGRSKKEGDTSLVNAALSGPNEIYVIGSKMMSTELGELSERVNNSYLKLNFNYKYDDPKDPERFFFRSDHFNYARKGIPIIFYFDGVHEDYHQPGDSVDKIDFDKMQKVTRTVFMTMWELANAANRPRVDKQLPPELR
jgi:Zn-dependent M28 family amino/carboxypeptidase